MRIGLIDVDSHHFPNIALMKLSAYHKARGDTVEWWNGLLSYDLVYMSRIFTNIYSKDEIHCIRADQIIRGGTGYDLSIKLPENIEHQYPDYSLYSQYTAAYGYLTRGCPRGCPFCIVSKKEGTRSVHVADLSEFWRGQKEIRLLDPNLLACKDHEKLLQQLADSGAWVHFTQGLDARLLNEDNVKLIDRVKVKNLHFAWDDPNDTSAPQMLGWFAKQTKLDDNHRSVYILTNFNSTHEQDLERIYKVWERGYRPYVMIYDKPGAPKITRHLQRWVNSIVLFRHIPNFADYISAKKSENIGI